LEEVIDDKPEKGWFGKTVKKHEAQLAQVETLLGGINDQLHALLERIEKMETVRDPEEMDDLWLNFERLTEVVSALRRINSFPPLAEFEGSRNRRLRKERAQAAARAV